MQSSGWFIFLFFLNSCRNCGLECKDNLSRLENTGFKTLGRR